MFDASLLNLPWATLVTLACGYIGYFIANVGLKEQHQPIEVTFSALIFGLFSAMVYHALTWAGLDAWTATLPTVGYAFASGAYWRRYARQWMYKFLRGNDISWSDNTISAWQAMFGHTGHRITEVYVILKDGSGLLSRYPGDYEAWPNGPLTLGCKGDIVLYVTHRSVAGTDEWVQYDGVVDDGWGALATYIPADQIARVDIRRISSNCQG